jgi:pilus assembly protein CpaE
MIAHMKALVVLDDLVDRNVVETLVTSTPRLSVADFLEMSAHEPTQRDAADVLIVACADYDGVIGDYITAANRVAPGRPIVLLCTAATNGYIGDALEAGADEIVAAATDGDLALARGMSEQLAFTVEKAIARRHGGNGNGAANGGAGVALGRMICVLGLKGGSGKTLTSANLAVTLADEGHTVALVDLDLQFGDVGLALGTSPERTVYDLVTSGGSLDAEKLSDFLMVHPSGARALLAPARPDQAGVVTPEFLRDVYQLLRETHEFVIVDTPPSFTPEVIGAVDASTDACVVAMLDSLSLKNAKLGMETLELMGYEGTVRVVLNRADTNVGIAPEDVVTIMGRVPDVLVPSDRGVVRSVNEGEPIALSQRRSDAARAFRALAAMYTPDTNGNGSHARRRVRLLRRGR